MTSKPLDVRHFKINANAKLIHDSEPGYRDCPGQFTFWAYGTHFTADIRLPETVETDSVWSIGFIQGITAASAMHIYGENGILRRDVHPLLSGIHHCVNDGDGSAMPFFDNLHSRVEIQPGIIPAGTTWHIQYSDWPYSCVENTSPPLTRVERLCNYLVWLIAIKWSQRRFGPNPSLTGNFRPDEDEVAIFCTYSWKSVINCCLNPTLPVGSRVKQFSYDLQDNPVKVNDCPLSLSVMVPPTYASAISSIWIPFSEPTNEAFLCQFPKEIIVDWKSWMNLMVPSFVNFLYDEENLKAVKQVANCGLDPIVQTVKITDSENVAKTNKHQRQQNNCNNEETIGFNDFELNANIPINNKYQRQQNNCNNEGSGNICNIAIKKRKKQSHNEVSDVCRSNVKCAMQQVACKFDIIPMANNAIRNNTKTGSMLNVALVRNPSPKSKIPLTTRFIGSQTPKNTTIANKTQNRLVTDSRIKNSCSYREKTYTFTLNLDQQQCLEKGNVVFNVVLNETDDKFEEKCSRPNSSLINQKSEISLMSVRRSWRSTRLRGQLISS